MRSSPRIPSHDALQGCFTSITSSGIGWLRMILVGRPAGPEVSTLRFPDYYRTMNVSAAARLVSLLVLVLFCAGADWPAWRGPRGNGVCDETGLPLNWSSTENVSWKAPLPGPGNSTPIVSGGKVFVDRKS